MKLRRRIAPQRAVLGPGSSKQEMATNETGLTLNSRAARRPAASRNVALPLVAAQSMRLRSIGMALAAVLAAKGCARRGNDDDSHFAGRTLIRLPRRRAPATSAAPRCRVLWRTSD